MSALIVFKKLSKMVFMEKINIKLYDKSLKGI